MTEDARPVPVVDLPDLTVVQDAGTQVHLLHIRGALVLPVGARIELGPDEPADAIVTAVRLWGANTRPTVTLEVMTVPPGELTDSV